MRMRSVSVVSHQIQNSPKCSEEEAKSNAQQFFLLCGMDVRTCMYYRLHMLNRPCIHHISIVHMYNYRGGTLDSLRRS